MNWIQTFHDKGQWWVFQK